MCRASLFRAVGPDELADIRRLGYLRNPPGIVVKYFAVTRAQAIWFARQAVAAFGDPPYAIIQVETVVSYLPKISVDRGIRIVVLDDNDLAGLKPRIIRYNVA
ncbi:hypothetical protein [Pseudoduganella buxea]|uniref:Uncharacterized protein n=1 Tax=Pseudoduganella buxea TaxID=1949069 RepID=A0A6I3T4B2_9BURK|nr:hypothetical protein [Pseudoduganella buxea]MTV56361.1 hypothetical protein [Pseudoduganella buxea]GGC21965.1 hypothetical protein GCM10011572_49280 [Pseudoduganella buxea]